MTFLGSTLMAKPCLPIYSTPADTLMVTERVEPEKEISTPSSKPDSLSAKPEKLLTPTWLAACDPCGLAAGFIDLTPDVNSQGPWLFMWSNGETTEDISGLTSGWYMVTIFDANQQLQLAQIFVAECGFVGPLDIDGVVTGNTLCNGSSNGAIDVTVFPPTGWTYLWSNGETTVDVANLDPGTYTLSVTFNVTCTTTATFIVPNLTNAPTLIPPIGGFGLDFCETGNGTAAIQAVGGTPPYTYLWSNGATDFNINGLTAGDYTVTVTGADGCTSTYDGPVPPGTLPVSVELNTLTPNTTCIGANGSITITVNPGGIWLPSAQYIWTNGATTQNISNLSPGTYWVTVTRLGVCTAVQGWYIEQEPILPSLSINNTSSSCGLNNGAVNLTVLPGGIAPYTYIWSNGATTEDLANIVAGNYDVTLTSGNGCTSTGSVMVEDNQAIFSYSATITDQTACDTINGRITLALFPANLAYQWSNGATTTNLNPLAPGDYTVTISAGGTCTAVETYSVGDIRAYPSIPAVATPSTCGLSNGSIDLSILGNAITPLTYHWSNDSITQDLSHLKADTFYVTVTSAVGCSATNMVIVPNKDTTVQIFPTIIDNISCTSPTGNIALNLTPLDSTYVFLWSNGQTVDSLSNLAAGIYMVTATLGVTCIALDTFEVLNNALFPSLSTASNAANCGQNNGAADLSVSGGAGPYTYLWSNMATSEDLTGLTPGTYSVTVSGANGCTALGSTDVLNNNLPLGVNGTLAANTSCAAVNGSVDVVVTPAGIYNYLWSNMATTEDLTNLAAGTYTVTVSLGTCLSSNTFTIADNALLPNSSTSSSAANCSLSNGSADLSVSGGTGPFTFLWSNTATTEDLTNVIPGAYSVTITGVNGCTAVNSATVLNNNVPPNVNGIPAGNTSCATANGSIDIGITPVDVYTYLWSNMATTEDINNLAAGNYTVTVSLGTCVSSSTFAVADNALSPNLTASSVAANCDLNDGSADLNVSGGAGPFTFIWSNMATTEDLTGLLPGTYSVTVTGANSCTSVSTTNVQNNNIALNISGAPVGNSSCTLVNGSLDISVAPTGNYTYLWSNMATTQDLSNLNSGSYTVTVTLGTCQSTNIFSVADNTATPILTDNITASICGINNGAIDLTVSGPAGPYTYLWSNMATTQDISSLLPGNYSVTVTAPNGCTEVANLNVANNASTFSLAATPTPLTDCAADNGAIDLNITPAGVYTYLWSNAATTEDLGNVPPGTYTVSVTQSGSCTATASYFVIDQRTNPVANQAIVAELCGQADGSIDLNVSGGTTPYGYLWNLGQVSQDLSNLTAGTYTVTVTDANHCTATTIAVVPGNSISFSLAGTFLANSSCLQNNGSVDLTVNPSGTFTYQWSNMATTQDLNGLNAGTYTVTVSAGGNCTNTADFTITNNVPSPQLAQSITAGFCGQASGGIDLSISGSPAPYLFLWSNMATTEDLSGVVSNTYSVTVTAANGCTTVDNFVVPENSFSPSIASTLSPASSCTVSNGAVDLTITPAMAYTYIWSNLATTEDLTNIPAGTYTVTVTAGGACSNTAIMMVPSDVPLPSVANTIAPATCGQASGSIDLTVTGSVGPYQFFWSNAATTEDLANTVSGTFTVTVTAANGCSSVESLTIPENVLLPQINGSVTASTSCVTNNGAIDLTVGPATGYTFIWSNAATTEDLINLAPGSYTVTVNGGGACTNTASFAITGTIPAPTLSNTLAAASCGQASGSIDLTVAGSPGPFGYLWSNAATTEDLTNILSGAFTVTVTAGNGCTTVGNFTVPENTITPVINGTPTADNSCVTINGAIDLTVGPATGYTFSWSNAATTEDLSNIPAGSYTVTVNGGGACTGTASFAVADQTTQPLASINAATTALDCSISTTTLNGSVSGTPNPSSFQWSSNGTPLGTGSSLLANAPGQYDLVVQDNVTFCTASASITVTQSLNPPGLAVASPSLLTCASPAQTLAGSSPISGVQFAWATISGTDTTILGNGATLPVSAAGTYFLFGVNPANNCANATSVTIIADQNPPTANAGAPFTLDCAGETAGLTGSGSGAANLAYQWTSQDGHFVSGAGTATPMIDEAGTYELIVTNTANGCTDTDLVTIEPEVPVAFASVIQPSCLEQQGTVQIDSITGLSEPILYSLNNGTPTAQNQFANLAPGTYTVEVLGGNGCSATVQAVVNQPALLEITLAPEATVVLGYTYQIDAQVSIPNANIDSIRWTPSIGLECDSCLSTLAMPNGTTDYQLLVVSKDGCEARGNLHLIVDKSRHIYAPNIFSPNDDGRNDVFTLVGDPVNVVKIKSLQVFSRWGEAVYERRDFDPTENNIGWDGTFKGQKMNPAVFVWQATVLYIDGKEEQFTGDVTLKR